MTSPELLVTTASGTAAIALSAAALLRGWRQWLDVRHVEMTSKSASGGPRSGSAELEDLRRRVRRLEAIASGAQA